MPAPRRRQCPSNTSAMTATMPKRCWQQCQRNDDASTATTVGRHAPSQRNACQWDVGDDASGNFSKDGKFVEDNNFSTKGNLAEDGSLAKEGNFNAVGNFVEGRQQATLAKVPARQRHQSFYNGRTSCGRCVQYHDGCGRD
jgi:hypothetical protein